METATENANATTTATEAATSEPEQVVYGRQEEASAQEEQQAPQVTAEQRKAEFERLIKEEYHDLYSERVKGEITRRFKGAEKARADLKEANEILDILKSNYGAADNAALKAAIEKDDSLVAKRANENGLTVEQQRRFDQLETKERMFDEYRRENEERVHREQTVAKWREEAEQAAQIYAGLSLEDEANHPETGEAFMRLLTAGIDVRTAYEVLHKDDIIGGAMQYTAQKVREKTVADIRARGLRPQENGTGAGAAAKTVKADPSKWTDKDMDEVIRRVRRGERIVL